MTLLERARKCVAKMPLAVSGERGHDTTFRVACCLVQGFGLSPEDALCLLREYNDKLLEKWTEHELRHKIDDATRGASPRPKRYLGFRRQRHPRISGRAPSKIVIWRIQKAEPPPPQLSSDAATQEKGRKAT
jgi:hypothetical protein